MSIEDVAHKDPNMIYKFNIDMSEGINVDDLLRAAHNLGIDKQRS
jgi:succinyl-CoA synthetase beta subunit